jgi:hypothetical protein
LLRFTIKFVRAIIVSMLNTIFIPFRMNLINIDGPIALSKILPILLKK